MRLTKKQIQHIALLARLEIAEDDFELYLKELSPVINYFEELKEVNTDNIEPTAQVTGIFNALRDDEVEECDEPIKTNALNQATEIKDGQIKVKKVL